MKIGSLTLLEGKAVANKVKGDIIVSCQEIIKRGQRPPHLTAVIVGDDGASKTYVQAKMRACKEVGYTSSDITLPATTSEQELIDVVKQLNNDDSVDGFIVQLPLPNHMSERKIIQLIEPKKDVDGFHPTNMGRMLMGLPSMFPATPTGILDILIYYNIETTGKHCVVVGRSNIVGAPMSVLMSQKGYPGNATVTMVHSKSGDISTYTKEADILIVAVGKPKMITKEMVKEGAIVIDVGIHRIEDDSKKRGYRLIGDVDFDSVQDKVKAITPVPGGVGPMTIASLLKNTLTAYFISHPIS